VTNPVTRAWLTFILLASSAGLLGCGSIPTGTSQNKSMCPDASLPFFFRGSAPESLRGARCVSADQQPVESTFRDVPRAAFAFTEKTVPDVFIGVSISGGGSRAANFGWAVLEQLHEVGILQHVSAISTTSGGGLAGGYYALRGPDWERGRDLMATDFQRKWIASWLAPQNLLKTSFTHADRSDLMSDIFDEVLFGGSTYEALGAFQPGERPIWIANATNVGSGRRFSFTTEAFGGLLGLNSQLHTYPISHAVMASAAFPGAFNSVTLRDHVPRWVSAHGEWREPPPEAYLHLIDGGPTDNLGLETLRVLASTHAQHKRLIGQAGGRCLLIIVDAFPSGVREPQRDAPDPRRWYDHVVDLNMLGAFDALLTRRRTDSLGYLGISNTKVVRTYIPRWDRLEVAPTSGLPASRILPNGALYVPAMPPDHFECLVWHINMSGTTGLGLWALPEGESVPRRYDYFEGGKAIFDYREKLDSVTGQIKTAFRLEGPEGCSSSFLRNTLYAAAYTLVREDQQSRTEVCGWMRRHDLAVREACDVYPSRTAPSIANMEGVSLADENFKSNIVQYPTASCGRVNPTIDH